MALFPRKIQGKYVMLSRQDGENNAIMLSRNLHFWQQAQILQEPEFPYEFVQMGNGGSPIETPEGWLVVTHGVGPMRTYSLGIELLDLDADGVFEVVIPLAPGSYQYKFVIDGNWTPDPNAAEAVQRVPGVSIERDQGEGRYVLVRGTEARLNSMMINGEAPYPVQRTLLTSGMVIGGIDSLFAGQKLLATPHLDVKYSAPTESTFWSD